MVKKIARRICISLPPALYREAHQLVEKGHYASMSALAQEAIRHLLKHEIGTREQPKRKPKQDEG